LLEKQLILLFEYFISKVSGYQNFEAKLHAREKVAVSNFAYFLMGRYGEGSIGPYLLYHYFVFQFEYWRTKKTREGEGRAQIRWVVGEKAFNRWLRKDSDYWYFCTEGLLKKHVDIKYSDVIGLLGKTEIGFDYVEVKMYEEVEKQRYFNTTKGFMHDILNTTLYNHKSELCLGCKNKESCKELLKTNYRKIYDDRGYNVQNLSGLLAE